MTGRERILKELLPSVQRNALISDARGWGHFSLCGVLLRLREQYRFDMGLPHGQMLDPAGVSDWIGKRESLWKQVESSEFVSLTIGGESYDPFDAASVNRRIADSGLVYGAGYGLHMKPVFFLADLLEIRREEDLTIRISGREYARDLSLNPAMAQGANIFARRHVMEVLIQGKYEEYAAGRKEGILAQAFRHHGVSTGMDDRSLEEIAAEEIEAVIRHEYGEAVESKRLGPSWMEMIRRVDDRRTSLFLRSLQDTLADTCEKGMLRFIADGKRIGALAFFLVFLEGYRRVLLQDIRDVSGDCSPGLDWESLDRARQRIYGRAQEFSSRLLDAYGDNDSEAVVQEASRLLDLLEDDGRPRSTGTNAR